ncbi:MAG: aminotransferase class III-fold pyridoxal phosphate-dependent enzyme [Egibacteraceae bacterium]
MMSNRYPLWHGWEPMGPFIRNITEDRFIVRGEGIRVRDASGRWFLDARSSCWNLSLGYSAQPVKDAIQRQLNELPFGTILVHEKIPQVTVRYARALSEIFGPALPFVRLGNSGSQMTETAVLLSRFVRTLEGNPERTAVLSFEDSYHGQGPGANAFSGSVATESSCGPLLPDVHFVAVEGSWKDNVSEALEELTPQRVTAVLVEPQMNAGTIPSPADLVDLAALCRSVGVHFIADEVTTGFGRTGAMSRCLDIGIEPDLLVLGKNMTSGYVPVGALLVSAPLYEIAYDPDPPLTLAAGSTTDGHPLAAAAGLAVLDVYERDGILEHVKRVGTFLQKRLQDVHGKHGGVGDITGAGLMQRFPLRDASGQPWTEESTDRLHSACEDNRLLLSFGDDCLWLVPPLIVTEEDCEEIAAALDAALERVV